MADTLEIFGTEYTGVTGIIATDDNGNDLTYTRGGGGVDMPTFTVVWDDDWEEIVSVTCDKTYAECSDYISQDIESALFIVKDQSETEVIVESGQFVNFSLATMIYTGTHMLVPEFDLVYNSNGTIDIQQPSQFNEILTITQNGTYYGTYASSHIEEVRVNVPSGSPTLQNKTVSPSESQQSVQADSGYDGLDTVTVNAISSTYVGTGITRRSSTDLTTSGATVTAPAGYYSVAASKSVASMTLPTSASSSATSGYTSKATIGRSTAAQYINIPPGYNGAGAYYVISATPNGSVTAPSSISGTTATISTGNGTLTLTKTVSVTPNVTTAGYISSGTAGNSSVSLTANVTINPTPTASGATVTIPAGYYSSQTTKSVTSGSATAPSTISGTAASVSTGTNTLTLTKTVSVTPTVSAGYVSAGTAGNASVSLTASITTKAAATYYATTSDQTISASQYLTGAQTIKALSQTNLSAANIASGTTISVNNGNTNVWSVTGTYTSDATAAATDIVSGETAYVNGRKVEGSLIIQSYYTGSSTPSSSLGNNGDIYFQS